jgi:hypothetical protein
MSKSVKDRRRFGIIEVAQVADHCFYLKIGGQLWSEVEWSPSRRTWCIQDACGHCLTHCESIVGQDIDQRAAIAEAKAMIRDGRMPTPEEAQAAMEERQHGRRVADASELAGEQLPMPLLEDDLSVPMPLLYPKD